MFNSRAKTAFLAKLAIRDLCRRSQQPILCTLTFTANLLERAEAVKRWKRLRERIVRTWPDVRGVGVWQRQKRGAWHLHLVINHALAVVKLRELAVATGWGQMMRLDFIGHRQGFRQGKSVEQVCNYVARYVTRELRADDAPRQENQPQHDQAIPVVYLKGSKMGSVRFNWAKGAGRLYRLGVAWVHEARADRLLDDDEYEDAPFWVLVRLGWELLSSEERGQMLCDSRAIREWWCGPPSEGNWLEPF